MSGKPFDQAAQDHIAARFRSCSPTAFLAELYLHAPQTRAEYAEFEKFRGWALYDAGNYQQSRSPLLKALRGLPRGSADRSLVRGLLSETYLRLGRFHRAERCVRRALFRGCDDDPGQAMQAGHLFMLGRIHSRTGHLTHALATLERAGALIDRGHRLWIPMTATIAQTHFFLNHLNEAEARLADCHAALADEGRQQGWIIAATECPLALAIGDVERADRVIRHAVDRLYGQSGERVRFILAEHEAAVLRARGRPRAAEAMLREILSGAVQGGRNSDAISSAARHLAQALMDQQRHAEGREVAWMAARAGSVDDRYEWVIALRLVGECSSALGEHDEARRAFREAMSVHASTEFVFERLRLERAMRVPDLGDDATSGDAGPRAATIGYSRRDEVVRMPLASGQVFVSRDHALIESIRATAVTTLPVLIEGETGTGKELVARLIHELSPFAGGPLVIVDCAALPEPLADVELFGAVRAIGGDQDRHGLIAQADGGSLVLDNLPELGAAVQARLLRVVQEGTYRRVGDDQLRHARVRIMAITNRGLPELLDRGALKPELFYRLDGHRLKMAPLRARPGEIGPIAHEIVTRSGLAGIEPDAIRRLHLFRWPGNVRQLEMILRLAASSCEIGATLRSADLEPHLDRLAVEGHLAGSWLEGRGTASRAESAPAGPMPVRAPR